MHSSQRRRFSLVVPSHGHLLSSQSTKYFPEIPFNSGDVARYNGHRAPLAGVSKPLPNPRPFRSLDVTTPGLGGREGGREGGVQYQVIKIKEEGQRHLDVFGQGTLTHWHALTSTPESRNSVSAAAYVIIRSI